MYAVHRFERSSTYQNIHIIKLHTYLGVHLCGGEAVLDQHAVDRGLHLAGDGRGGGQVGYGERHLDLLLRLGLRGAAGLDDLRHPHELRALQHWAQVGRGGV